jgi:multiple sugar transport system permease protein
MTPGRRHRRRQTGLAFIAPFALLFILVFIAPIVYSGYSSLFQQRMVGGDRFVGLDNYAKLLTDSQFWDGVARVFRFTAIQVPIMLVFAICLALAIDSLHLHGTRFFRIAVFLPYAVPARVSTLMWGFMLGTKYGLFKNVNQLFSAHMNPFNPGTTLISIGVMVTWAFTGYDMLIFYSALKTVPQELYEAAAIDGAGEWQVIRRVKLPAMKNSLLITVIFSIIGSFQLFNEPKILTAMVANSGITTYYTPNMYAYNLAFTGSRQGYAAALALVMAAITMIFAYIVQLRGLRTSDVE